MADLNDLQKFEEELKHLVKRYKLNPQETEVTTLMTVNEHGRPFQDRQYDNDMIRRMAIREHGRPYQEHQIRQTQPNPQVTVTPWIRSTIIPDNPHQLTRMAVHEHGRPFDHQMRQVQLNPQATVTPWIDHTPSPQVITRMAVHEHGRPFMSTNMAIREHGKPFQNQEQNNCDLRKTLEDNAKELMGNVTFMGVPEHGRPFMTAKGKEFMDNVTGYGRPFKK